MDRKWKTVVKLQQRQPSGRKRRNECTFFPNKSYCFRPEKNKANGTWMKIANIPSRCDTLLQFCPRKPQNTTLRIPSHSGVLCLTHRRGPSALHTHNNPCDARCFQGVAPTAVGSVSDCEQRKASIVTLVWETNTSGICRSIMEGTKGDVVVSQGDIYKK